MMIITGALVLEELRRRANQFQMSYVMCKIKGLLLLLELENPIETYGCGIGHCDMEDASGASRSS